MKRLLLFLAILLIGLLIFGGASCLRRRAADTGPATLTFYGLDDSDVFEPLIAQYKQQHPSVSITYKKFNDPVEFENLLVNEIAEGEGPDIFYAHNTWLPRHLKKLAPLAPDVLTPENFNDFFVNVVSEDFLQPDPTDGVKKIYALPLYVDTLALYYNKKTFEQKLPQRGKPASTWAQIKEEAALLREEDPETETLQHGAIALGRTDNIHLAPDILYNLFLQAGIDFYDSEFKRVTFSSAAKEAFDLFLGFAIQQNKQFSWSADLVSVDRSLGEVEAFLTGKVAAIIAYSDLYQKFENELKNVRTRSSSFISFNDIAVMPLPQLTVNESDYRVWANYYGLGVSRNSKSKEVAWDFIRFLVNKERAAFYHQKTKRPTARRDLVESQKAEPITEIFVSQLGYAGSYRIFSDQRFAQALREAVNSVHAGMTSSAALGAAETKMNDVLKQEAPKGLYPKPQKRK